MKSWENIENLENKTGNLHERFVERSQGRIPPEYGLCSRCDNAKIIRTKLYDHIIWCGVFNFKEEWTPKIQPNHNDPIVECSKYYPKGQVDLMEMKRIAWLVDVNRNPIGFAGEVKVTITEPEEEGK